MKTSLTLANLGWIGGFFDGEGTFTIAKKRPNLKHHEVHTLYQPKVMISNTDKRPIEWFKDNVGGNFYSYKARTTVHKDYYRWEIYGDGICEFIQTILPYLRIKSEPAMVVLELQKRVTAYKAPRVAGRKGRCPMEACEIEAREALYQRIRKLNKRGK